MTIVIGDERTDLPLCVWLCLPSPLSLSLSLSAAPSTGRSDYRAANDLGIRHRTIDYFIILLQFY